ncbi:SigE family RNA polymerase sigma factor [Rugosimonospora acidiphila]|uniref:SigE family RNA polymerase sigma factor n=1 Tax=Rugosimonospora acidiphila TaxID=556531 RepID=A0ABP9RNN4_9ACTN
MTFEEYVRQRGAALVRVARLLTGDVQLGEDLAQDVLAKAYPRWSRIVRTERPDLYLRRMLVNANVSRQRRRAAQEYVGVGTIEGVVPAAEHEIVERDEIWRLLAGLPRRQRAAVVLRYYEDLDDAMIAEILDCAPVTVRTHVMRALATLRERIDQRTTPSLGARR